MRPENMTHQEHLVRSLERHRRHWQEQVGRARFNLLIVMGLILATVIASGETYTTPRLLLLAAFGIIWLNQANRAMVASAMLGSIKIAQEDLADADDE